MANIAKNFYNIPEIAIQAYERWSGLNVAIHTMLHRINLHIPHTRINHRNPFCDLLKLKGYEPECADFESNQLRPFLEHHPGGCVKKCHAGIVELSVPVKADGNIGAVLFAGLCRGGGDVDIDLVDSHVSPAYDLWPKDVPRPHAIDQDEAQFYLEGLRQLGARIEQWLQQLSDLESSGGPENQTIGKDRRLIIHRFISNRFQEPVELEDLANILYLSRSRTAHLVRELYGQTFGKLITEVRIRHAAALLRNTSLPVSAIASRSGYGDVSNFHKAFKRSVKMTPLKYRQHNSGEIGR